jgi:hypothetical protein
MGNQHSGKLTGKHCTHSLTGQVVALQELRLPGLLGAVPDPFDLGACSVTCVGYIDMGCMRSKRGSRKCWCLSVGARAKCGDWHTLGRFHGPSAPLGPASLTRLDRRDHRLSGVILAEVRCRPLPSECTLTSSISDRYRGSTSILMIPLV